MAAKRHDGSTLVAENRKARHEYFITDSWEAGIELLGSEVKSLRRGQSNIAESYCLRRRGRHMAYQQLYRRISPAPLSFRMSRGANAGS